MSKTNATYRIGDAIAVTQRLPNGTWLATFPGFIGLGASESDALVTLATEVEGASKRLRLQAIEVADSTSTEPRAVVIRTCAPPGASDVYGQVVCAVTGEILHESAYWPVACRKDAQADAEQIATRKGYRVVELYP